MTVSVHVGPVTGITPRSPLAPGGKGPLAGPSGGGAAATSQESSPIVLIPGVLWLTYATTATPTDSVTLYAYLFGAKIDTLSGVVDFSAGTASLTETFDIDIFGAKILDGRAELDLDATGIKASGDLEWLGEQVLDGSAYLYKWPWASAPAAAAAALAD